MIKKLFSILEYMSKRTGQVRLQDLATHLNMSQSTLLRYLNAMIREGYVFHDKDTMGYALTWKICKIGSDLSSPLAAKCIVSPYVNHLCQDIGLGAAAMVMQGYEGIYVDLIDDPTTLLTSLVRLGNCPPLNATASGKVLLSQLSSLELEDFYTLKGLESKTPSTIVDRNKLMEELESVRTLGYALEIDECTEGVECVAMPIYDYRNKIYMALSVFDNKHITEPSYLKEQILPKLSKCAKEVSLRLGCSENQLKSYIY
ncbi:MAG: IclR family transcriptional regulator [Clostridium sp.]|nr:IclR family transcriptional regulator [Clostridium sp.]